MAVPLLETSLYSTVFLFFVLFLSAPAISHFFNQPQLIPLLRVMGAIVIINAFAIIQRTILVKKVDFKTQTKVSLISSITSGAIGIGMAVGGCGVWSLVGQHISRQFLNSAFLWIFSKWYPKLQFSLESFKELFSFGWKLLCSGLLDAVYRNIYNLVIGKKFSSETLGLYNKGEQIPKLVTVNIDGAISSVMLPAYAKEQ